MLAAQPCAAAFYGTEVTQLTPAQQTQLVNAAMAVLWGPSRTRRCREIVLTLFAPGHLVDPQQALTYRRLVAFHRMVSLRPDLRDLLLRVRARQGPAALGPVGLVLDALRTLQWSWGSTWTVTTPGAAYDLLCVPSSEWAHAVRQALRLRQWCAASVRRTTDMPGIELGIDRDATSAGWNTATSSLVAGMIRSILAGEVWTQERLHRAAPTKHTSPNCNYCANAVPETLQHLWWDCPGWDYVRRNHPAAVTAWRPSWPRCLAYCGIMPVGLYARAADQIEIATAVQGLMAAILLARRERQTPAPLGRTSSASAPGSLAPSTRPSGFPWGWCPPGPHERFALQHIPLPRKTHGVCTPAHYVALCAYLHDLEWPRLSPSDQARAIYNVTFVELALDFELYTGLALPAAKRRAPGTVAPLVDRALALSSLLDLASAQATPAPLYGGVKKKRVYSLAPVGVHRSAGLSRRPILLCGAETENILDQLLRSSCQGVPSAASGQPQTIKGWWQSFTPTYPPDRVDRTAEWEALARSRPRAAAPSTSSPPSSGAPRSPLAGGGGLPGPPPAVSAAVSSQPEPSPEPTQLPSWTLTPSALVPPGVDKRPCLGTQLVALCEPHGRCLCEPCRTSLVRPQLLRCCQLHHSASAPRMTDFCEAHRRTPCARCQALSSRADICCGKGHHTPPPPPTSPLSAADLPTEASPLKHERPLPSRVLAPGRARRGPPGTGTPPGSLAQPRPPAPSSQDVLPNSPPLPLSAAVARARPRKRSPAAEASPPPPRKRRPARAPAGSLPRGQPTLQQFLGKRARAPGDPEDAAPVAQKRPKPGHGHGRAEPEARQD